MKFNSLLRSSFVRHVSVLAGGTAFAQALALLALPLLTRIYSPEEFGVLAVFAALLGMISVVSALRYQIAIPLPETDRSAANLLAVSLFFVVVVTALTGVATYLFSQQIASLMNAPSLASLLWLLPAGVAMAGSYSVFQYWATRKKAFTNIARTRVEQSIGGVSTQLLMGWAGMGAVGLIVGQIVSNGAGVFGLARRAAKEDGAAFREVRVAEMRKVGLEYDRYPKYSTFESFTNTAGIQLPIILIASLVAGAEVGFLMLAIRVMQTPAGLVGASISQVYFPRAVEAHREGRLGDLTARTIGGLSKAGVGPLIFIGMIAPAAFGLVFGKEWQRTGELVAWMTPWFVFQFLASPVSMSLHVTNHQRTSLVIQAAGLILRVLMVLGAGAIFDGEYVSEAFALSGFVFYFFYLMVVCHVAGITVRHGIGILIGSLPYIAAAVLLALGVRVLI